MNDFTYQYVFNDSIDHMVTIQGWLWVISMSSAIIGIILRLLVNINKRLGQAGIAMVIIAAISVLGLFTSCIYPTFTHTNPYAVQEANMNANLQHKYDATLNSSTTRYTDDYLTQTHQYVLSFPNGSKGTYNMKWDKATNEPTIMDTPALPTSDQLNQQANKK